MNLYTKRNMYTEPELLRINLYTLGWFPRYDHAAKI